MKTKKTILIFLIIIFQLTSCQNNESNLPVEQSKETNSENEQQEEVDIDTDNTNLVEESQDKKDSEKQIDNDDNLEENRLTLYEEYQTLNEEEKRSFEHKLVNSIKEKHGYPNGAVYKIDQNSIQIFLCNEIIEDIKDCKALIIDYKSNEVIKGVYLDTNIIGNKIYISNNNSAEDKYFIATVYNFNEENEIMYSKLAFINKEDQNLQLEVLKEYELNNPQGIIPTITEFTLKLADDYLIFQDVDMYWKIVDLKTKEIFASNETVADYSEHTQLNEKLGKYINVLKYKLTGKILTFDTEERVFSILDKKDIGIFNIDIDKVGDEILDFIIIDIDDKRETGFEEVKFKGQVTLEGKLIYNNLDEIYSLMISSKEIDKVLPTSVFLYDKAKEKENIFININNEEVLVEILGEERLNELKLNLDSTCDFIGRFENYVSLIRDESSPGHNIDLVELISFDEVKVKTDSIYEKFLYAKEKDEKILSELNNPNEWFVNQLYFDRFHYIAINKKNTDFKLIDASDVNYLGKFKENPLLEYKKSYCSVDGRDYYYNIENQTLYTFNDNNTPKVILEGQEYLYNMCISDNNLYVLLRNNNELIIKKITSDGNVIDIFSGILSNMKKLKNGVIAFVESMDDNDRVLSLKPTGEIEILVETETNKRIRNFEIVNNELFILVNGKLFKINQGNKTQFVYNRSINDFFVYKDMIFFKLDLRYKDIYKMDTDFKNVELIYNEIQDKYATIVENRIISKAEAVEGYYDINTNKDNENRGIILNPYPLQPEIGYNFKHSFQECDGNVLYIDSSKDNKLIIDNIDLNNPQIMIDEPIKWYKTCDNIIYYISYYDNNLYILNIDTNTKEMVLENVHYFTKQDNLIFYIPVSEQNSLYMFDELTVESTKVLNKAIEQVILIDKQLFYISSEDNCLYVLNIKNNSENQVTKEPVKLIRKHNNKLYIYQEISNKIIYELDLETNKLLFHNFNDLFTFDILFDKEMMYSITADDAGSFYVERDLLEYNPDIEIDYEYNGVKYIERKYWVKMSYLYSYKPNSRELIRLTDVAFDEMITHENIIYLVNSYDTAFIAAYDLDTNTISYIEEPIMDYCCEYKVEIIDGELVYELIKH